MKTTAGICSTRTRYMASCWATASPPVACCARASEPATEPVEVAAWLRKTDANSLRIASPSAGLMGGWLSSCGASSGPRLAALAPALGIFGILLGLGDALCPREYKERTNEPPFGPLIFDCLTPPAWFLV